MYCLECYILLISHNIFTIKTLWYILHLGSKTFSRDYVCVYVVISIVIVPEVNAPVIGMVTAVGEGQPAVMLLLPERALGLFF
jgi:hypothetical protein